MRETEFPKSYWVKCPTCKERTRTKIYEDSLLIHFPLYFRRCKKEIVVDIIHCKIYASTRKS